MFISVDTQRESATHSGSPTHPAVRAEVSGLLKAWLIEPGYSNWCSPVLCVVKKDTEKGATGKDIRLKIAVDFRKLNAATELDTGSLGDQGDILETFHNRPYNSLCDAAGGYHQCEIHPSDKHKTCFVLPMSCGGTTFVWRIVPNGLTNKPAIYSRAMQYVCRGPQDHNLGYVLGQNGEALDTQKSWLGRGSLNSWLDDLTIATGKASPGLGVKRNCEMLQRVFKRLIAAGITLKLSKSHILRKELKVLGCIVTRGGIRPNLEKVKTLHKMPDKLKDKKAVLRFLGNVNFNSRFIRRLGHTTSPLYHFLKKNVQ
eukprot:6212065-Pleurochrysis_carterae.AAC.4